MTHSSEIAKRVPFVLCALKPLDISVYNSAIQDADLLRNCYNPKTQMADVPQYGGTALTYSDSYCGILNTSKDDTNQSDT
jgi:hypothetical protein